MGQAAASWLLRCSSRPSGRRWRSSTRFAGVLTLRSSTASSERIDPATAARHGIQPSPGTAVLNVVMLRGTTPKTFPAEVSAVPRSLAGV